MRRPAPQRSRFGRFRAAAVLLLLLGISFQLAGAAPAGLLPVPEPDISRMEPAVRAQLAAARRGLDELASPAGASLIPAAAAAYGEAGGLYLLYGLLDAAAAALADAESLAPREVRWPYYLGVAAQQRDDAEAARRALAHALALAPRDVPTLLRLGEVELLADHLEAARERFAVALAADPGSAAAHAGLGRVALAERQGAAAAEHFAAALAAQPTATSLHAQLAAAFRLAGQADRARNEASRYGEGRVTFPDPWMDRLAEADAGTRGHAARAAKALATGRFTVAADEYGKVLAVDPADADAWGNLGVAREALGDAPAAAEAYRKAIALAPEKPRPHYNLGTLLARRGAVAEGIAELRSAVYLAPDLQDARLNLATALLAAGRDREARAELEEGLAKTANADFAADLIRVLACSADPAVRDGARALSLAQRLLAGGDSAVGQALEAMALAELGSFPEATAHQRRALDAAAGGAADPATVARLRADLAGYAASRPCREPWKDASATRP